MFIFVFYAELRKLAIFLRKVEKQCPKITKDIIFPHCKRPERIGVLIDAKCVIINKIPFGAILFVI